MKPATEAACCLRPNISDSLRKHICLRANTANRGEGEAEASWRCLEAKWDVECVWDCLHCRTIFRVFWRTRTERVALLFHLSPAWIVHPSFSGFFIASFRRSDFFSFRMFSRKRRTRSMQRKIAFNNNSVRSRKAQLDLMLRRYSLPINLHLSASFQLLKILIDRRQTQTLFLSIKKTRTIRIWQKKKKKQLLHISNFLILTWLIDNEPRWETSLSIENKRPGRMQRKIASEAFDNEAVVYTDPQVRITSLSIRKGEHDGVYACTYTRRRHYKSAR